MKLSFVWTKMIADLMFVLLGDIIIIEYYDLVSVLTTNTTRDNVLKQNKSLYKFCWLAEIHLLYW